MPDLLLDVATALQPLLGDAVNDVEFADLVDTVVSARMAPARC